MTATGLSVKLLSSHVVVEAVSDEAIEAKHLPPSTPSLTRAHSPGKTNTDWNGLEAVLQPVICPAASIDRKKSLLDITLIDL